MTHQAVLRKALWVCVLLVRILSGAARAAANETPVTFAIKGCALRPGAKLTVSVLRHEDETLARPRQETFDRTGVILAQGRARVTLPAGGYTGEIVTGDCGTDIIFGVAPDSRRTIVVRAHRLRKRLPGNDAPDYYSPPSGDVAIRLPSDGLRANGIAATGQRFSAIVDNGTAYFDNVPAGDLAVTIETLSGRLGHRCISVPANFKLHLVDATHWQNDKPGCSRRTGAR